MATREWQFRKGSEKITKRFDDDPYSALCRVDEEEEVERQHPDGSLPDEQKWGEPRDE